MGAQDRCPRAEAPAQERSGRAAAAGGGGEAAAEETKADAARDGGGIRTEVWNFFSSTKDGNDVREELVEGVNCLGQGTNHILVWSDQVGKGQTEPYFLGFLFCKVTDKMGRVAKSCCYEYNAYYDNRFFHAHRMLFALNENHGWWKEGVDTSTGNSESWWTYPDNNGIFNYFPPET